MIRADPVAMLLAAERDWFYEPRNSSDFAAQVDRIDQQVPSNFLFNRTEPQWFLEALTLSSYTSLQNIERVWLNRTDPPDAFVVEKGKKRSIEITEVLEPGRKRGREYRKPELIFDETAADWRLRAEKIAPTLRTSIDKKLRKGFSDSILLVYLNMSDYGIRQIETENEIQSILESEYQDWDVKVIWKDKLYTRLA